MDTSLSERGAGVKSLAAPLLEVRNVAKWFGKGERRILALDRVNLVIRPGEFVVLLGPSGCGKSTLLRIITGLAQPSEGEVLYRGERLRGVNPHATIVFQSFALYPWLTVQGNVEAALKARGIPAEERRARALALIDKVGLDGFENAYPRELSGGMRQKVGFARAMAVEPELLCLDEPFSALDVLSAESLRGELMELWTAKAIPTQAILMVTHNIEEAVFMADRIVVMDKDPGHVVAELEVTLPHPRSRKDVHFIHMVDQVYATIAGKTQPEEVEMGSAPGEPGKTEMLPHAPLGALAGLLEVIASAGGRADLYVLGEELVMNLDELLPVIEAAERLGFAQVDRGDIVITPLGESFAEAGILARKEIFRQRIRRVPVIRWIYTTLEQAEGHRLPEEVFLRALEEDFTEDEAKRQLDTAISWGRYAELFAFDDNADELFLEETVPVASNPAPGG